MSVSLNYKTTGQGKPLLILHGLFGSLDNWQTMAKTISEQGFEVFTIDLRNHGKSPHTKEMNHELMAEDVAQLIEDRQLGSVILMGHSMGGKTAMKLAFMYPELIEKLIVVDIAPKPYAAHHYLYFDAMLGLNISTIESRADAMKALGKTIKNKAVLQFLLKNLERNKEGGYNWVFHLNALHANYEQLINGLQTNQSFSKPTLFIHGKLSDYITKADHAEIFRLFPNAVFSPIEGAGHWVHAEQPKPFFNALMQFISAV